MIHVIADEDGKVLGLIANISDDALACGIRLVDESFRKLVDRTPSDELERALCDDLGIPYSAELTYWTDVLMAYLVDSGGAPVEYSVVSAVPNRSAGQTTGVQV